MHNSSVKLIRLAAVHLDGLHRPDGEDDINLNVMPFHSTAYGLEVRPLQVSGRRAGGKTVARVVLAAEAQLGDELPTLTEDGLLIIPSAPREAAEAVLRLTADVIAVAEGCARTISSPTPSVGLRAESPAEIELLERATAICASGTVRLLRAWHPIDRNAIGQIADRPDGAALMAEALSARSALGAIVGYIRLFERAFRTRQNSLIDALASFMATSSFGYSRDELAHVVKELRKAAVHGARNEELAFETEAASMIARVEHIAYDVLFNKAEWRTPSAERRDVWRPPVGVQPGGTPVLTQGREASMTFQLLDEFDVFPVDLSGAEDAMPSGWWSRMSNREEPTQTGPMNGDLAAAN